MTLSQLLKTNLHRVAHITWLILRVDDMSAPLNTRRDGCIYSTEAPSARRQAIKYNDFISEVKSSHA